MKERPILFNAPMVRAILDDTKTQTRRVFKAKNGGVWPNRNDLPGMRQILRNCPYGKPGDRLWVRETWVDEHPLAIQDGRYSQPGRAGIPGPPPVDFRTIYRADGEPLQIWRNRDQSHPYFTRSGPASQIDAEYPTVSSNYQRGGKAIYWWPSIHMPRWASRITLEITGVRVERLQDISPSDAIAEGLEREPGTAHWKQYDKSPGGWRYWESPIQSYRTLWESINGPDNWAANPWVWVVEFKRLGQPA